MAFERVCALSEVPEEGSLQVQLPDVDVAVVRFEGELFALEDRCSHADVPLTDGDGLRARLVMSINPDTCEADGPYVIVGATEYTLAEAAALATSLMALLRGFHGVDNLGG